MPAPWPIILLCLAYLIGSPLMAWWVQTRHKGSMLDKVVTLLATPGALIVLLLLALPLSIPYFWLYPERHKTTIDANGTDAEKTALAEYRSALGRETLWNRFLFRSGVRGTSENRLAAEESIGRVWKDYKTRKEREKEEESPHRK
jgi:hypothetical protein